MVKRKLSKRAIVGILAILVSILLIAIVVILLNKFKIKTYDINDLRNKLVDGYEELYLTDMDHVDILNLYGFEKSEVEDALYLFLISSSNLKSTLLYSLLSLFLASI